MVSFFQFQSNSKIKQMKKFSIYFIVLAFLGFEQACKNPITEFNGFQLNMNSMLANTPIRVQFKSNNPIKPLPQDIQVTISGEQAGNVFDVDGRTNFPVSGGSLDLLIGPGFEPSENNPLSFTLEVNAEGFMPVRQELFVFSKDKRLTITIGMDDINANKPGVTTLQRDFDFLGKKKKDTVSFEMTRWDGVRFVVKYPMQDLVFTRSKNVQFKIGERINVIEQFSDSITGREVVIDSIQDTTYEIVQVVSVQLYKNQIAEETLKRVTGTKMRYVENVKLTTKKVSIGFVRDTVPIYSTRTIVDTIPIQNVGADISSSSSFLECGFWDENGNYIDKPRFFDGVVGLPYVRFYDKTATNYYDRAISAIYYGRNSGRVIEVYLKSKDYNLFASGVAQSLVGDYYYSVKRGVDLKDEKNFIPYGSGYKMILQDNLINAQYFLYKSSLQGCGFAKLTINHPLVDFKRGFYGDVWVYNDSGQVSYSYSLSDYLDSDGNEMKDIYTIPTFYGIETTMRIAINHPENIDTNTCGLNGPLYYSSTRASLCNYLGSAGFSINVPYNMVDFFTRPGKPAPPPPIPVQLRASILCSGGNSIVPPDIVLLYRKLGKLGKVERCAPPVRPEPSDYATVRLENGEIKSLAFESEGTYEVLYQRISSMGNLLNIYDTITFWKMPSYEVKDEVSGYWTGTIKYTGVSFDVNFVFDNRKLRYEIKGCGK